MRRLFSAAVILAAGCATASKDITPAYVSPLQYESYSCDQLSAEALRIQTRVAQLGGRLDEAATHDKEITGVGIVVFWPALFFLGGTKQQEAEYAQLSGQYQAIQQAAIQKKCPALVPQQTAGQPAVQPTAQPATKPAVVPVSAQPTTQAPAATLQPVSTLSTPAAPTTK